MNYAMKLAIVLVIVVLISLLDIAMKHYFGSNASVKDGALAGLIWHLLHLQQGDREIRKSISSLLSIK